jgi:hypothetical protein
LLGRHDSDDLGLVSFFTDGRSIGEHDRRFIEDCVGGDPAYLAAAGLPGRPEPNLSLLTCPSARRMSPGLYPRGPNRRFANKQGGGCIKRIKRYKNYKLPETLVSIGWYPDIVEPLRASMSRGGASRGILHKKAANRRDIFCRAGLAVGLFL